MIVTFCVDLINYSKYAHNFMYHKYLNFCRNNGGILICNEFFSKWTPRNKGESVAMQGTGVRWDFEYVEPERRDEVKQYHIPDAMFDELAERKKSRLEASLIWQNEIYQPLYDFLDGCIRDIMENSGEKIDAFLLLEKSVRSIDELGKKYGIPVICNGKGPLRSPYYIETAYFNFGDVYGTNECEQRYNQFLKEWDNSFEFLSNKELLALFMNPDYIKYLPFYDTEPSYKMLVAGTYCVMPTLFSKTMASDIELINFAREKYSNSYMYRPNPADPFEAKYHLKPERIDTSNPSFLAILKSEKVASMGSNILFDTMLWNRVSCCNTGLFPFGFMCEQDYAAEDGKKAPEDFLNFFCFAYLVPLKLAWDSDYIKWRLSRPSEMELFRRHLEYFLDEKGIDRKCLEMPKSERLAAILAYQGFGTDKMTEEYSSCLTDELLLSTLENDNNKLTVFTRKTGQNGSTQIYESEFIPKKNAGSVMIFTPIEKKGARIKIVRGTFECEDSNALPTMFRPAVDCERTPQCDIFKGNNIPSYKIGGPYDKCRRVVITWQLVEEVPEAGGAAPAKAPAKAPEKPQALPRDVVEKLNRLEGMENSMSWKITKPLRAIKHFFVK